MTRQETCNTGNHQQLRILPLHKGTDTEHERVQTAFAKMDAHESLDQFL